MRSLSRDPFARPEELVRRVYAFVAYRIGSGPEAEDVTSETFARALTFRSSFDPAKGEPVAWLIGIARRQIADRTAARVETPFAETPERAAPGDLAGDAAERLTLAAALARLERRDRELLSLRYGADLTARQIAALLEARTNSIEVALHRALGRLRRELDPLADGSESALQPVRIEPARPVLGVRTPEGLDEGSEA